jgi:TPR repeat protein
MAYDVFISYASEDKIVADAVCATLESHSVRCWIAPRDVLPGMAYGEAIIDAIRGCRIMVLVFSSSSNISPHIPKEIERAVSAGVAVVPFRIEDVRPGKSLDYFIGSVHWLDALTQPLEQHLQRLVQNVQTLLSRDSMVIEPVKSSASAAPASAVGSMPSPALSAGAIPAPTAPGPARPPWLYVALGIMALLVVVFAVLLLARKPSKTAQVVPATPAAQATPAPVAPAAPAIAETVAPAGSPNAGAPAVAGTSPPSEMSSPANDAAASKPTAAPSGSQPAPSSEPDVHGSVPAPVKPKIPTTPSTSAEDLFDQGSASYNGGQFSQAAKLYQRACDGGERKACNGLGLMYFKGEGMPKDVKRAQVFFKRACDAGGAGGCLNLGLLYFRGEDVPKDLKRAAVLFKRSCDAGGGHGCNNLGLLYHDGEGMPKDLSRAADLYKRACEGGDSAGCTNQCPFEVKVCRRTLPMPPIFSGADVMEATPPVVTTSACSMSTVVAWRKIPDAPSISSRRRVTRAVNWDAAILPA